MKLYTAATGEVQAMVKDAIARWHPELSDAGANVLAIMVSSDDDKPALSHGGFPVLACIAVVPEQDRLTKAHDAEMFINQEAFDSMSCAKRLALIDHELTHLAAKVKKRKRTYTGPAIVERDQFGRPRLQLRKGDWNVGDGFKEVVERHGENASELENIARAYSFTMRIVNEAGQ